MFRKDASTNTYKPILVSAGLLLTVWLQILGGVLKIAGQDAPNLEQPLKKCWSYGNGNGLSRILASDNESNILLTVDNYSIVSLNSSTRLENWKSTTGGKLDPQAVVDENNLYFITSFENALDHKIYTVNSISLKTGITNWQVRYDEATELSLVQFLNKELIFLTTDRNSIAALGKSSGQNMWTKRFESPINAVSGSPDLSNLNILFEDRVRVISFKNGETLEETILRGENITNSIVSEKYILLGTSTGEIAKLKSGSRRLETDWNIKTGAGISGLFEYRDEVLATSLDNFIYLFSRDRGKLRWKKRVAGRINLKPQIYGTFAVVLNAGDNSTAVIDLRDGKTVNVYELEENNFFSGQAYIAGSYMVFQTSKGLYFVANRSAGCK